MEKLNLATLDLGSSRVILENGEVCFYHERNKNYNYRVAAEQLNTDSGLIHWIAHMTEKNWITTRHINELIRDVYPLLNPETKHGRW